MTREELLTQAKPILFNTEMVKAILEGRKTVTRRICKDGNDFCVPDMSFYNADKRTYAVHNYCNPKCTYEYKVSLVERTCPICPGDILYVRETWNISNMCADGNKVTFIYRGDKSEEDSARTISVSEDAFDKYDEMMYEYMPEWRPSIHMPKEAARIFLKVTDVRVERLQDITEEQAEAEGIDLVNKIHQGFVDGTEIFADLWNSTIKKADLDKYGWEANPWVWVVEFERVEVKA